MISQPGTIFCVRDCHSRIAQVDEYVDGSARSGLVCGRFGPSPGQTRPGDGSVDGSGGEGGEDSAGALGLGQTGP